MLAAFALSLVTGLSGADAPLTSFYEEIPASATNVSFDFARSCRVENHEFILEKTTLAELIASLGRGEIKGNHRDAAECETFVDFAEGSNLVRFSSNCEMGGGDLDQVEVRPAGVAELAELPRLQSPVMFLFGKQGMSFDQLRHCLGIARLTSGNVFYIHDQKAPVIAGKASDFRAYATLIAKIQHGVVSEIDLTRVTTN